MCWFNVHLVRFYNHRLKQKRKREKKKRSYKAQLSQRWTKRHGKMNCKSKWEICEGDSVAASAVAVTKRATFLRIGQPKNKSHSIHLREENFRGSFVHVTFTQKKRISTFYTRSLVTHRTISFDFVCFVLNVERMAMSETCFITLLFPCLVCTHTNIEVYWLFM